MKTQIASAVALAAISFAPVLVPTAVWAQNAPAAHHHDAGSAGKACSDCAATCEKTLAYFKKKGGKYAEAKNLDTLKDCIALCKASADLKSRNSSYAKQLDAVCHDVCKKCAEMCKSMNDDKLKDCIQSCETCHDCCG